MGSSELRPVRNYERKYLMTIKGLKEHKKFVVTDTCTRREWIEERTTRGGDMSLRSVCSETRQEIFTVHTKTKSYVKGMI